MTENASGGGTPFHDWYMSSPRAKKTVARDDGNVRAYANAPWCAMFVSWVGEFETDRRPDPDHNRDHIGQRRACFVIARRLLDKCRYRDGDAAWIAAGKRWRGLRPT